MSFPSPAARMSGPLPEAVAEHVRSCPLAWVSTFGEHGPNVAPKEIWTVRDDSFWFAVIASPTTVSNVESGSDVCVAAIDIWSQRGHKFGGPARVDEPPPDVADELRLLAGPLFDLKRFIGVDVAWWSVVVAPSQRRPEGRNDTDVISDSLRTYLASRLDAGTPPFPD